MLPNILGTNVTATTPWVEAAGPIGLAVWGTWGGTTASVEWSPTTGANNTALPGFSFTADSGPQQVNLPKGGMIRLVITGGSGQSLNWGYGLIQGV